MRVCVRSLALLALLAVVAAAAVSLPSQALKVGLKQRVSGNINRQRGDAGGGGTPDV